MKIDPNLLSNKHNPTYWQLRPKWIDALNFYEPVANTATNAGLAQYLTRHPKEDPEEFAARLRRLYQINCIKMVVDFYMSMLFSTNVTISADEHKDKVDAFVKSCNHQGDSLLEYMQDQVGPQSLVYGVADVFIDLPTPSDDVNSRADEVEQGLDQPYCFCVPPLNRVRWQTDDYRRYTFYQSEDAIDTNITPQFQVKHKEQWQIWTLDSYSVYGKDGQMVSSEPNNYGFIPAVTITPLPSVRFYNDKIGVSLIDDLVEIQREMLNLLSLISDYHTQVNFGQRVIIQDIDAGADSPTEGEFQEMGNHRGMRLEGKGSKFEVVTPDPAGVIAMQGYVGQLMDAIFKLALVPVDSSEIKTHTSAQGIKNNLQQLFNRLTKIARQFEKSMKQMIDMSLRVQGLDAQAANVSVQWDTGFSYEAFATNIEQLQALKDAASDISPTAIREYTKKVVTSELCSSGKLDEINAEIDKWEPVKPIDPATLQNKLPGEKDKPLPPAK